VVQVKTTIVQVNLKRALTAVVFLWSQTHVYLISYISLCKLLKLPYFNCCYL